MRIWLEYLALLLVIFSNYNHVNAVSVCEESYDHCHKKCSRKHPDNAVNREKCNNKCEHHFNACLQDPPPVVIEPPVVVEPFVEPYPWGWGWHHHEGWRGWHHYGHHHR